MNVAVGATGAPCTVAGMDTDTAADWDFVRSLVADARRPVVLTGAGVSVGSGLPTYRGLGGTWTEDPEREARSTPPPAKMCDPAARRQWWDRLWELWGPVRALCDASGPNSAHLALAEWESRVEELWVVTQNVDGLHTAAGSSRVVELHGRLFTNRCVKARCSQRRWADRDPRTTAPDCPRCGRPARPDVVLFTESLDRNDVARAHSALTGADLVLVVGTSGTVWPAADFPALAARGGIPVVRIDPGPWHGPHVQWAAQLEMGADSLAALLAP